MNQPVYIHGLGLLTGLDRCHESTWDAILSGKRLATQGVVSDHLLSDQIRQDRAVRIAIPVLQSALNDAGWPAPLTDVPLFVGSSKGLILSVLNACDALRNGSDLSEDQMLAVTLGPAAVGRILRHQFQLLPGAHTSVAACASGLFALHAAVRALRSGECRRAVVLAADASLHPLVESSFQRLGLISPPDADGRRRCDPFDPSGKGFFLSEAAAVLALSCDSPSAGRRYPLIEDTWTGADAGHLLAIDPQTSSLRCGLKTVCNQQHIDFVHAHATGTAHDAYEFSAIRDVCGKSPTVFSSKYWLGHSLGAAGLVSLALSVLCHHHGRTLNGKMLEPQSRSVTIAQGFGGHIAVIKLNNGR